MFDFDAMAGLSYKLTVHPRLKRIAFLGRGVHTIPSYRALLNKLAIEYEIVVYSEVKLDPSWLHLNPRYSFRFSNAMGFPRRMRELFFLIWLIKEHIKTPFDLVHAHSTFPTGFTAVILQRLFGIPAIVSLDGGEGVSFPDIEFGDRDNFLRTVINKWIINRAKVVTALTCFHRDLIYKNLTISRSIEVVTRGVDIEKFHRSVTKKIEYPIKFLSVGYLSPIKDPETLLRAFSLIQQHVDCRLTVVGKDYMNGIVQRMAQDMGLSDKVNFIGHVDYERVCEYYNLADVLLHTSRYESQGMVIGEAMASGVLVCGTNVGLMSDLSGECCLTVQPKDAEALATTVFDLLASDEKMNGLRMNAYRWTEKNDLGQNVINFSSIYSELLMTKKF